MCNKVSKKKLFLKFMSVVISATAIFPTLNSYAVGKKCLSKKQKIGISALAVTVGLPLVYVLGNKVSYEMLKSENNVDMRGLTRRGYNNKGINMTALRTGKEKEAYLFDKWVRTRLWDFNNFFDWQIGPKTPYNRVPLFFATYLPTVQNVQTINDLHFYERHRNTNGIVQTEVQNFEKGEESKFLECFKNEGELRPYYDYPCEYNEDYNRKNYMRPYYIGDESQFPHFSNERDPYIKLCDLLPLCLSNPPDEKYFKTYYYRVEFSCGATVLRPYERFDFLSWARDTFPNKSIEDVVRKHTEVFLKYGAKSEGETWVLPDDFDLISAQNEISEWQQSCNS